MTSVPAQKLREAVFQALFCLQMAPGDREALEGLLSAELGVTREAIGEAYQRAALIRSHASQLDEEIAAAAQAYDIERISVVEKSILRLAIFELLFDDAIPPKVAIAEAIRLTRKFSTPAAAAFVNAVLDTIYKKSLGQPVDEHLLKQSVDELKLSQEIAEEASQEHAHPKDEDLPQP